MNCKRSKSWMVRRPGNYVHVMCSASLSVEGRRGLLEINLKEVKLSDDCDFDKIAKETDGYSGADITNVCR